MLDWTERWHNGYIWHRPLYVFRAMQDNFVCVAQDEKWFWTRLVGIILIDGPHRRK